MWSRLFALAAVAAALVASACQVAPLYGTGGGSIAPGTVAVAEVDTRVAQQVREALIGSLGRPTVVDPLTLTLDARASEASYLRSARLGRATRGSVTVIARYTLSDRGEAIASGTETAVAEFDAPIQLFARQRAIRDAENRAARLAAQRVRLAIAPALARGRNDLSVAGDLAVPPERDPE